MPVRASMNRRLPKSTVAPAPHLLENVALDPTRLWIAVARQRQASDATPVARAGRALDQAENILLGVTTSQSWRLCCLLLQTADQF